MTELMKGDRVRVKIGYHGARRDVDFTGFIVGESRGDNKAWMIIKDGTKWPRGIHKSFCRPEKKE